MAGLPDVGEIRAALRLADIEVEIKRSVLK